MRQLSVYADTSVIGGCEDEEFSEDTLKLWKMFKKGEYLLVVSDLTLQEIAGAPDSVRRRLIELPLEHQIRAPFSMEARALAEAYLAHGIVGPGAWADALHVALPTVARADVLASWNFKHIVNLDRIRLFNAVNMEQGYGFIEIRTPREVLRNEKDL